MHRKQLLSCTTKSRALPKYMPHPVLAAARCCLVVNSFSGGVHTRCTARYTFLHPADAHPVLAATRLCCLPPYSKMPVWSSGTHGLAAAVSPQSSVAARAAISPKPR